MSWRQAVVCCALAIAACKKPPPAEEVPPGIVRVLDDSAVIKQGPIGVKETADGTYVLVDAENISPDLRQVAVEGNLLDAGGQLLGPLSIDELVVPSGQKRTFALVYAGVAPAAARVDVKVRSARIPPHAPVVTIGDVSTEKDGEALAAIGRIQNGLDRDAVVTVIATFYDVDGKIMTRPFVILELQPNASRPFRFTGPAGATTANMYLGDVAY